MRKWDKLQYETTAVLNSFTDNVFIADTDLKLVWMNEAAEKLISKFTHHIKVSDPEELIGIDLTKMHSKETRFLRVMTKHELPYRATINIFDGYVADIVISNLETKEGNHYGYLLFWRDVTTEEKRKERDRALIEELSTPVLPSVLDNTLFVPLIGNFDENRMEHLKETVLHEVVRRGSDYLIFDMSGIRAMENNSMIAQFHNFNETVALTGVETYFVGFTRDLVKSFIAGGVKVESKSFPHYRQAVLHILKQEGLELQKAANKDKNKNRKNKSE